MPQVPYNPVPQVSPQNDATPRYTADVTPDMFGANIGQAVSRLGATSEAVGNEIFARGLHEYLSEFLERIYDLGDLINATYFWSTDE